MDITSLELSGFKNYDNHMQFNFKDAHDNFIFDTDSNTKTFFFEIILGIIFGFNASEKERFRGNPDVNKTFTGLLTLSLDKRTMIIERDFETDFVACLLSDPKITRSIFQGKDFVDNGYSRPYLQMLRSVFPVINKELFLEVCYDDAIQTHSNFSDLLNTLYSLLTPQFKFNNIKYLVNEGHRLEKICQEFSEDEQKVEKLKYTRQALQHIIKMSDTEELMKNDIGKLDLLVFKMKRRIASRHKIVRQIDKKFQKLKFFDPLKLRADVLMWRSLLNVKQTSEDNLRSFTLRQKHISNILNHDLYEYTKLSPAFSKEAGRFKALSSMLTDAENSMAHYKLQIEKTKEKSAKSGKRKLVGSVFLPLIIFSLTSFLLYPVWPIIIGATVFTVISVITAYSLFEHKRREKLYMLMEETHTLEKRINQANKERYDLLVKNSFFKDEEYLDSHLIRLKKCQQFQHELKSLKEEETKIIELLNSGVYTQQIKGYQNKYGSAIDINRRDLEEYLDEFIQFNQELEGQSDTIEKDPAISELNNLALKHRNSIKELVTARKKIQKSLKMENGRISISEILDKLDRTIKNFQIKESADSLAILH